MDLVDCIKMCNPNLLQKALKNDNIAHIYLVLCLLYSPPPSIPLTGAQGGRGLPYGQTGQSQTRQDSMARPVRNEGTRDNDKAIKMNTSKREKLMCCNIPLVENS